MSDGGVRRMVVEMSTPLHTRVKIKAAKQRITLRRLAILLLEEWLTREDSPPADNPLHVPEQKKEPSPIRLVNEIHS